MTGGTGPWAGEFTIGVEEEFQFVDASSRALRPRAHEVVDNSPERLQRELHSSQVEASTPVCGSLAEVRAEVTRLRADAAAAAGGAGARLAAAGTHPFSSWAEQPITPSERYRMLDAYYRRTARETVIFASHFHIGIRDPDGVVDVMNRVRVWIPPLLALSANSPFWGGADTGFSSFRAELARRWPVADVPRRFASRAEYEELTEALVTAGLIEDATQIYWDVRPSDHYQTLEFRITDVAMTVDETVMLAGLVRALARTCAGEAERGIEAERFPPELLLAAKWRAARDGLRDRLIDVRAQTSVPAAELLDRLLGYVRRALEEAGEWDEVSSLVAHTLRDGTGAERQRAVYARTGELADVVDLIVAETARDVH